MMLDIVSDVPKIRIYTYYVTHVSTKPVDPSIMEKDIMRCVMNKVEKDQRTVYSE
jgi:hypothetical protein